MKRLFRFRKTVAVLAGAGIAVIVAGVGAVAQGGGGGVTVCFPNGGGAISTEPCDPATESAVTLSTFAPVIRTFEKPDFTAAIAQDVHLLNDTRTYTTIIRMDGLPNGFYKIDANGFLDDANDLGSDEGPTDWQCQLVLQNADNVSGTVLDYWELEKLDDATYFLKAAVNIDASGADPTSSVYVRCNSGAVLWKAAFQKIIAVDAADLIHMNGS